MTELAGVIHDLPDAIYHQAKHALSSTGARKLLSPSTPKHFREWADTEQSSTDAFDLGKVVHAMVLGSGAEFVEAPFKDWKTKASQQARDEAREAGLVPLLTRDMLTAKRMAAAVLSDDDANEAFGPGSAEVSVFADDPITGTPLRARFDWLREDQEAVDLKTSQSAELGDFERSANKYGYAVQDAFYRHVAECAGLHIKRFRFVVVEKTPPHPVTVHEWDTEALSWAAEQVREAIDLYHHCVTTNDWPSYPRGVHVMRLSPWLMRERDRKAADQIIAELEGLTA